MIRLSEIREVRTELWSLVMENCCYHGKILCTYELKDDYGYYYEDKVIDWKEAAAERRLTCVECGRSGLFGSGSG
jgi:hypothetical protein